MQPVGASEWILASASSAPDAGRATDLADIGSADFLRLMVAQLRNQDPFKPLDQMQFIAELAELRSAAGIMELTDGLATLTQMQTIAQLGNLIGRTVRGYDAATGAAVEGTVSAIEFGAGGPALIVGDARVGVADIELIQ
jgi:flagellar basal-body rod modification protein FlgD